MLPLEGRLGSGRTIHTHALLLTALALAATACSSEEGASAAAPIVADAGAADADAGPTLPGNQDPKDLDPTTGDPSLDVAASEIFFDNGAPWVRATFFGDWPPASSLYAWSCSVLLGTENAPVATYVIQGHSGKLATATDGIDETKITYAPEPKGFRVLFGDPKLAFDRYGLDCTVQRTVDSATAEDTSGNFVVSEKVQRPFGP